MATLPTFHQHILMGHEPPTSAFCGAIALYRADAPRDTPVACARRPR